MPPTFQIVNQGAPVCRTKHVWLMVLQYVSDLRDPNHGKPLPHNPGDPWKCVVCGGISTSPTNEGECSKYEPLTDAERAIDASLPRTRLYCGAGGEGYSRPIPHEPGGENDKDKGRKRRK